MWLDSFYGNIDECEKGVSQWQEKVTCVASSLTRRSLCSFTLIAGVKLNESSRSCWNIDVSPSDEVPVIYHHGDVIAGKRVEQFSISELELGD